MYLKLLASILTGALFVACIPTHLEKYSRRSQSPATGPAAELGAEGERSAFAQRAPRSERKGYQEVQRPPIYAIDRQTYRFHIPFDDVWDSAINVLLRNYILTIVDRASGVITTEWDTFFIEDQVYRNRVSMRIHRVGRGTIDVILHNNVERLQDSSTVAGGGIGSIWLPSDDVGNELNRLVQNMAVALNQPPPATTDVGRTARRGQVR